jgi:uncharacterized protein (TIGR02217 family)
MSGQPTIYSVAYLKTNIEGGEKFNWYYADGNNLGIGLDPAGSELHVSLPQGDRLTQSRNAYSANQQLLANKQLRWWWNNQHYAVYDTGSGWQPQGAPTQWVPNSKSITFAEYGLPACDKGTNQPNIFYSTASTASGTPYWSIWDASESVPGGYWPHRDDLLYLLALQAVYEYWVTDGNNAIVGGVPMIQTAFMSVWDWDARPFPAFPQLTGVWGDAGDWPAGNWLQGKGPFIAPPVPDNPPAPGAYPVFPTLPTLGWSVKLSPIFSTGTALHVSGREVRTANYLAPRWLIALDYDLLRMVSANTELQEIIGFFAECQGENAPFYFEPVTISPVTGQAIGTGDGVTTTFPFTVSIGDFTLSPASVATPPNVYLDGALQSSGFTVNAAAPAGVTFATAPGAGVVVSADFHWFFLCRFDDDSEDVEEFMAKLYALQSLRLRTVRS